MHAVSTCSIVGRQTLPVVIDGPKVNGAIWTTFKPAGAYRFLPISLHELGDGAVKSYEIILRTRLQAMQSGPLSMRRFPARTGLTQRRSL